MMKGPGSVYDKWNISVVICEFILLWLQFCLLWEYPITITTETCRHAHWIRHLRFYWIVISKYM